MRALVSQLLLPVLGIAIVIVTAYLLYRGFYIETVTEASQTNTGGQAFFHKCRYLSFSGTHDVDSILQSPTLEAAQKAYCPYFYH